MAPHKYNNVKLGLFVLTGIAALVIALFLIGRNQHMLGSHYTLRANFSNVSGLRTGNSVRYAGIEVGTVEDLIITNDTILEVRMLINKEMKKVIRSNALASIGADGLMGNKVINIVPQSPEAPYAVDGAILPSRMAVDFDDILRTLAGTTGNIQEISEGLKSTIYRINHSEALWKLLGDSLLVRNLRKTVKNLEHTSVNADVMTGDIRTMMADIKDGKGNLGMIIRDSSMAIGLQESIGQLKGVAEEANKLAANLDLMTKDINREIQQGDGPVNLVLKDSALSGTISRTLLNVEKGTASFSENMEAMKHNFLFRGYFKKQEKEKAKQQKNSQR